MRAAGLFETPPREREPILEGMVLLRAFFDSGALLPLVTAVTDDAPLRRMVTPGGRRMSVEMSNCGELGWVSDRRGYRYDRVDPATGRPWPAMPSELAALARAAASVCGYDAFEPDVCLVNRYQPGARLGSHQDRDESDLSQPIVSASMGLPATFVVRGARRSGRGRRLELRDGDVLVFGGASRLAYHGVEALLDGAHPVTGRCRVNLTFRRAR